MGFRDSRRAAKKARKLSEQAQQDAGLDEVMKQARQVQEAFLKQASGEAAADPQELDERLKALQAEALGAGEGMTSEGVPGMLESTELAAIGAARFEVRLGAAAYGPGDTVDAVLVAAEPVTKSRSITAELRYVDESSDYVEGITHASSGSLHQGTLVQGAELPITLQLPADALPNWPEGGGVETLAEQGPMIRLETSAPGRLQWELVVHVDVPRGSDITDRHPLPLIADPGAWRGTAVEPGERSVNRVVKGWDVEIEPDRWALRRGEELTAALTIGKPAADRTDLRAGLVCEAIYDEEHTSTDGDGHQTTSRATVKTPVFEEWAAIDPAAPSQRLQLRVPEDAPFSYPRYKKAAFGLEWKVVAREDKRMRRDPRREATIQVAP